MTEHQPREHAVRCGRCLQATTWNFEGVCDTCKGDDDRDELREQILLDKHDMEVALTEDSRIDPNPGGPDYPWPTDAPPLGQGNDYVTCGAFLSMHHPVRRATGQQECLCLIPTADLPKACPQCGQWKS